MEMQKPVLGDLCRLDTRYGAFVVPEESDLIGDTLRAYGEWAENEISLLCAMIRPGDTVLDIGACYGTHSRAFSAAVGEMGRVISFEANEQTGKVLQENIALAPLANIEMHRLALDAVSGRIVSMGAAPKNRGAIHIMASSSFEVEECGSARTATLDEFSLQRADLLKIDVEGHEIRVIAGGTQTLSSCRPVVFCETNSISAGIELYKSWSIDDYYVAGVRSFAANQNNFLKNKEDFFEDASECALLFVPEERRSDIPTQVQGNVITPIRHSEDIVSLMLGQVQYLSAFWAMNEERHALSQMQILIGDLRKQLNNSAKPALKKIAAKLRTLPFHK